MKRKLITITLFSIIGLVLLQIPISVLEGSNVKFTLFDLIAPISGALVGTPIGIAAVFLTNIVNLLIGGFGSFEKASLIRLFPTLFAVWYFSRKDRTQLLIPIIAIIAFNLHPQGRAAWLYSMFWLIPLVSYPLKGRFLIFRALGATFTAHAVGGAIWVWAFGLPAAVWISLIPVVILERGIFTLGISASYILSNNILGIFSKSKYVQKFVSVDKKYLFRFSK